MFSTKPWATGSITAAKTIGSVEVAFWKATTLWLEEASTTIRRKPDQFRGITAKTIGIGGRPTGVDADIAPDSPAGLLQALKECC